MQRWHIPRLGSVGRPDELLDLGEVVAVLNDPVLDEATTLGNMGLDRLVRDAVLGHGLGPLGIGNHGLARILDREHKGTTVEIRSRTV